MKFFETEEIRYKSGAALNYIKKASISEVDKKLITSLLNIYINFGSVLDRACFTVNKYSDSIKLMLDNLSSDNLSAIKYFYKYTVKIYIELYSMDDDILSGTMFSETVDKLVRSKEVYGYEEIESTIFFYPIKLNSLVRDQAEAELDRKTISLNKSASNIDESTIRWQEWVENKQKQIDQIKAKLEQYYSRYNFTGLYYAFEQMYNLKFKEAEKAGKKVLRYQWGILLLNSLMVVLAIFLVVSKLEIANYYYSFFPFLTANIIFLYFYRVGLQESRSLNSQLLQIDLRRGLCQFIHGYSEYRKGSKTEGKDFLEGFESVIFSPIVFDPKDIPSTFDGLDGIAKIIQAASKK